MTCVKTTLLGLLLGVQISCVACVTAPPDKQPVVLSIIGPAASSQDLAELSGNAPGLDLEPNKFNVIFELVVFVEQIEQYPETWKQFRAAMYEWARHLPIKFIAYHENPTMIHPLMGPHLYRHRPGVIQVHMADLSSSAYGLSDRLLGMWQSSRQRILLDADSLETRPEYAYSTSLHEIGHMLGVPHVVGANDPGLTGFIILRQEVDAENWVMYPRQVKDKPQKILHSLEIALARHNLMHYWTRPNIPRRGSDDCGFLLDKGD